MRIKLLDCQDAILAQKAKEKSSEDTITRGIRYSNKYYRSNRSVLQCQKEVSQEEWVDLVE